MLELELFSTIYGKTCNLINNSISVETFKGYIHPTLINWIPMLDFGCVWGDPQLYYLKSFVGW